MRLRKLGMFIRVNVPRDPRALILTNCAWLIGSILPALMHTQRFSLTALPLQ